VAVGWHRSGASAVYQVLLRGLGTGNLRIPATVNGQPLNTCLDTVYAALRMPASEGLRAALDRLRQTLPDLAGRTYPQILADLRGAQARAQR
jgi:hypothetical protein